ncbi:hypothetical protein PLA107_031815 (plasmid) [Pseudomonas amygdali pv. lachrymans str. M301315]|nr:hypothetical protein PLA107_031815 [Pseudomonas amygdali pv. lachrymans str. M301315]
MLQCLPLVLKAFRSIPVVMTEHWFVIPMMVLTHCMGEPLHQGLMFWLFFTGFWGLFTFAYTRFYPRELRLKLREVAWRPLSAMIVMAYAFPLVCAAYMTKAAIDLQEKKSEALETERQSKEF